MKPIRLYMDEDSMSRSLVRALSVRSVDVTTALEEKMVERSDEEHLDYATGQGRVLFSFNVADFLSPLHGLPYQRQETWWNSFSSPATHIVGQQMRCLLRLIATM